MNTINEIFSCFFFSVGGLASGQLPASDIGAGTLFFFFFFFFFFGAETTRFGLRLRPGFVGIQVRRQLRTVAVSAGGLLRPAQRGRRGLPAQAHLRGQRRRRRPAAAQPTLPAPVRAQSGLPSAAAVPSRAEEVLHLLLGQ